MLSIFARLTSTRTRSSFFLNLRRNRSFFVVFLHFHRLKENTFFFRCFLFVKLRRLSYRFSRLFLTLSHHKSISIFDRHISWSSYFSTVISKSYSVFDFFRYRNFFLSFFFILSFFHEKFIYFDNNRISFNRVINKINIDIFDFCFFRKNDFTNFINFD